MKRILWRAAVLAFAVAAPALAQTISGPGNVPSGYPSGNGAVSLPQSSGSRTAAIAPATTPVIGSGSSSGGSGSAGGGSRSTAIGAATGDGGATGSVQVLCPRSGIIDDTPFLLGTDLSCAP